MGEDINILEEMCNEIINEDSCNLFETLSPYEIALEIKNLIKGYRELEERIIYLVNERKKLEELLFASNENYIEKSKVKEKIEVLESFKGLTMYEKCRYDVVINHLQELMEDK